MPVRRFNGEDDWIGLGYGSGGWDLTGEQTWLALTRITSGWRIGWAPHHSDSFAAGFQLEVAGDGSVNLYSAPTYGSVDSPAGVVPLEAWRLWGFTRTPTLRPRLHSYDPITRRFLHAEGWQALVDPRASGSGGHLRIGQAEAGYWFEGEFAALACWPRDLGDVGVEAVAALPSLASWRTLSPSGLWTFEQEDPDTPVIDRSGNGADSWLTVGTEVIDSDPPIPYALPAPSGPTVRMLDARGDLVTRTIRDSTGAAMTMQGG